MKTKTLLTLGAAILTVATLNLSAANIALSPRAAANQIKVVPSTAESAIVAVSDGVLRSPRAAANQIVRVGQSESTVAKCPVVGSPKYLASAGNNAPTACCGMTIGQCPAMAACAK